MITTANGRSRLTKLFQPSLALNNLSPWEALRQVLAQEGHNVTNRLQFGETGQDIRVLTTVDQASGLSLELDDLRTPADNQGAADQILDIVRSLIENPDTRVIASIAGGRKTMGALLYACMTLIGRPIDRLTHVLVSEPFELVPDFWFPSQPGDPLSRPASRTSEQRDSQPPKTFNPSEAVIHLADVPFVPLRGLLKAKLQRNPGRFAGLVATATRTMDEWQSNRAQDLSLRIDIRTLKTWLNDAEVQLPPSQFLLLLFLAVRATQNNSPGLPSYKDAATAFVPFLDGLKADTELDPQHRLLPMFDRSWDDSFLNRTVSDLRKSLKAVGEGGDILANLLPNRGRFSLQLPSSSISILPRAPRK